MKTLECFAGMHHYFAMPVGLTSQEEEIFLKLKTELDEKMDSMMESTFSGELYVTFGDESGITAVLAQGLQRLVELAGYSAYLQRMPDGWLFGITFAH